MIGSPSSWEHTEIAFAEVVERVEQSVREEYDSEESAVQTAAATQVGILDLRVS